MKVLSLRQPWANAVVFGGKRIENRRWNTKFRGEFLIHAAKAMPDDYYEDTVQWMAQAGLVFPTPDRDTIKRGGIIGIARLDGVLRPKSGKLVSEDEAAFSAHHPDAAEILKWWMPEQYGFVLRDVRPLPFLPMRGALSFFDAPADMEAAVRGILKGVCACESELADPGLTHLATCPYSDPAFDSGSVL